MSYLNQVINLAGNVNQSLRVSRGFKNCLKVDIEYLWIKDDIMLRSVCGKSPDDIEAACRDFIKNLAGKEIAYRPPKELGKSRVFTAFDLR